MERIRNIITYFNDDTSTTRDALVASLLDWRAGADGYESGWNDVLDKIGACRR